MLGLAEANDPLLRAKSLLAQELPMSLVAQQVGLPLARVRKAATEQNWLRRSRRDPYSPAVRAEALREYEKTGSMTKASRVLGIARQTLMRWIRAAKPFHRADAVQWRCYECSPFGLRVEGATCPGCGTIRSWDADGDALLN